MARRKKDHWATRTKRSNIVLTIVSILLGLGVIGLTAKLLDNKYGWVQEVRDRLATSTEDDDEPPLTSDVTSEEE